MGRVVGLVFEETAAADLSDLTKAELKEKLEAAGIEYDDRMTEETAAADLSDLTKAELKEKLEAAGIEYDDRMTKDELIALFKE